MQFEKLGPYRLSKKLGQGGMGAVYEGLDTDSNTVAAVKVLSPALAVDEGFRIRFQAEIESLKKLRHPNIVRLLGYGEEKGSLFYAMELVRGSSLEEELRAGRRFDWREVTDLAIKLCRALKHAHDSGVIHRDIKPANLLLSEGGEIKLSDFGIARLFGNTRMTSDGGVLGTAEYMAPEQADGRMVTDRCDQYSLGGVMYALLAGRPPFRAGSLEMLQLQRFAEPEPVRRYAPDTPAELDQIIRQLLEKDPQQRFANALILGRALESMQRGLSLSLSEPATRDDFAVAGNDAYELEPAIDPLAATVAPTTPDAPAPKSPPKTLPKSATKAPTKSPTKLLPKSPGVTDPVHTLTIAHTDSPRRRETATDEEAEVPPVDRFIKVEEKEDERTWLDDLRPIITSWQTWAIVAGLAAIGGLAIYLLQPPSADRLYGQIEQTVDPADPKTILAVRDTAAEFMRLYPGDPRAGVVQNYLDQAEELRSQRKQHLKNIGLNLPLSRRSPVERAYREALFYKVPDPEQALARFQALLDLYGGNPAAEDGEWLELARKEVATLSSQLAEDHAKDLSAIEAQLAHADKVRTSDPAAAEKIYRAIVTLYADKPWAAELVGEAKEALAGITGTNGKK